MASLAVVGALPFSIRFQSLSLSSSSSSSRLSFHSRSEILGTSLSLSPSSSSSSLSQCLLPLPLSIRCGRGDRKTAKGKRFNHSFGNARPRNKKKGRGPPRVPVPPAPPKRDKFDDGVIVKIEIDESLFNG